MCYCSGERSNNLINDKIAAFYVDIEKDESPNEANKFFNDNHTLDFAKICTFMLADLNVTNKNQMTDFQTFNYEDFLQIYNKMRPILKESVRIIEKINMEQLHLDWLGDKDFVGKALKDPWVSNYGTANVEKILLITSMLEFALGNVYFTISDFKSPPHLLRDLLCTKELEAIFGTETLMLLRILIGTPKSVNLRNIVWHGFAAPDTIPTHYVAILLLIIHSLGQTLEAKNFKLNCRKQIVDFSAPLGKILDASEIPNNFIIEFKKYWESVDSSPLIAQQYKPFWQQLFSYLQAAGDHWRFVILILPQIELLLRLFYAELNNFDVSAKLYEYYITLDTIFEPTVPNNNNLVNRIFDETCGLTKGALHFMYDIFLAPNGPRLRDKISHGEVSFAALNNKTLCETLLFLFLNLMTKNEESFPLAKYESQFHVNSNAKCALNSALKSYNEFVLSFKIEVETNSSLASIESDVKIFQRPKTEAVFMLLIGNIAKLLIETCHNFDESIKLRQSLLVQHELHSNRRRTLENLFKTLPLFCCCFHLVLKCSFECFFELQALEADLDVEHSNLLQRFLKQSLKIAENFAKYSHKESNEWIKITELCKTFNDIHKRLYLKFKESTSNQCRI